jgi:hypothetical protein
MSFCVLQIPSTECVPTLTCTFLSPLMLRVTVTDEVTYFVLLLGKVLVSGIVGK